MDEDQLKMNDTIQQQEDEIRELKLKLSSKDLELANDDLQYELAAQEQNDQTLDEGEEGEESKFDGLNGEFGKGSDSRVEADNDHSGLPLVDGDQDLSELDGSSGNMMVNGNSEAEYAEIDTGAQNDIFEQDNCKCRRRVLVRTLSMKSMAFSAFNDAVGARLRFEFAIIVIAFSIDFCAFRRRVRPNGHYQQANLSRPREPKLELGKHDQPALGGRCA